MSDTRRFRVQHTGTGWFFIVTIDSKTGDLVMGEAASYQGIATLVLGQEVFIAVSDYHAGTAPLNGPALRPNVVYRIESQTMEQL